MTVTTADAPPKPASSENPPAGRSSPGEQPAKPSTRYIVNVLLLAALWAGIAAYVRVHFEPGWRDQWASWLGGGASIWTIFETGNSVLQRFGKRIATFSTKRMRGWLNTAAARWIIVTALLLTGTAFVATSSLFLYRDDDSSSDVVEVRLTPSSFKYNDLVLDGTHRVAGGRVYFAKTVHLSAKTTRPHRQCEAERMTFHMGTSIKFAYPSRMPCFQYHIVRLMPIGSLWDVLPSFGEDEIQPYYVQIQIGGRNYPNMPKPLRKQIIEIGAPLNELPQQLDNDAKADVTKSYAAAFPGIPDVALQQAVNHVSAAPPLAIGTPRIESDTIIVNIYDRVDATKPLSPAIAVPISEQSTTISIDWKGP